MIGCTHVSVVVGLPRCVVCGLVAIQSRVLVAMIFRADDMFHQRIIGKL